MTSVYVAHRTCGRCGKNYTAITNWSGREHKVTICGSCKTRPATNAASLAASLLTKPLPNLPGAACKGMDPEAWFPGQYDDGQEAREVCARCSVKDACLEWALSTGQRHGIYGGLDDRERELERVRRRRRKAAAR